MVDARGVPRFSVQVGTIHEHSETKKGRMMVRFHLVAQVIIVRVRLTSIMLVRVQPRPQHKKYNWGEWRNGYTRQISNFVFQKKHSLLSGLYHSSGCSSVRSRMPALGAGGRGSKSRHPDL